jgi:Ca2+-binding RTX toxin-like protein
MGAFAGARTPMMVVAVVVALGVLVPATSGQRASPGNRALAAQLLARDPGARVGGNSQVATATRVRVLGVPRRMNFILGLGPREWIVGGARDDQLGARGDANRVYGAAGNDLIHGGPGAQMLYGGPGIDALYGGRGDDRLDGGPGNDRIIDAQGATTVRTGTGRDRVDVGDGHPDDRVLCAPGSIKRIHADGDDRIEASCRRSAATRVIYRWPATAPPAHAAQTVSGDGSNERPYTAPCDDPDSGLCTVSAFASRTFTHLWANEYVPAYQCPPDQPYLLDESYSLATLPNGVEVQGLGPVGVSITGVSTSQQNVGGQAVDVGMGTKTGFPNSSATSWSLRPVSYKVILHCTNDLSHAAQFPGGGPL